MKVWMGFFNSESNQHATQLMDKENFIYKEGNQLIQAMHTEEIFRKEKIEIIPGFYANGHPAGLVTKRAFDYIFQKFKSSIQENEDEIDAIFIYLHGGSKVQGLIGDSAEHALLSMIREEVGCYMPIAVVMDPHSNLSEPFVKQANILRCYRHSPHTDIKETYEFVAKKLCKLMRQRKKITPAFYKLPMILGGEKSVTTDEPMITINNYLDELEKEERIQSISFHVGYLRHDSDKLGCSIVVVPEKEEDFSFAEEVANKAAHFILERKEQFHYHGKTATLEEAIEMSLNCEGSPFFITDSGDNCGAGADGFNTTFLHQFYERKEILTKNILISGIIDFENYSLLKEKAVGDEVQFRLGMNKDERSKPFPLVGKLIAKGWIDQEYVGKEKGQSLAIKLKDAPITVVVEGESISYTELEQLELLEINWKNYDIFVVKQGYLSPDFKKICSDYVMALTEGDTNQRTENLIFKKIMRPIFPYDKI